MCSNPISTSYLLFLGFFWDASVPVGRNSKKVVENSSLKQVHV